MTDKTFGELLRQKQGDARKRERAERATDGLEEAYRHLSTALTDMKEAAYAASAEYGLN